MSPVRAWIGLGGNIEDPAWHVRSGLAALARLPRTTPGPASELYRSSPVGVTDQPPFCNAVAAVDTGLPALALLAALQDVEQEHGRRRTRRWGPRTLDLDLLLYGHERIDEQALTVPHPRLHERGFVLIPLAQVAPHVIVPGAGSVAALASRVDVGDVVAWEDG